FILSDGGDPRHPPSFPTRRSSDLPLRVRWIILRGLGVIHLSVFWSLAGQIHGLIGPHGLLPATEYLATLRAELTTPARLWLAPSDRKSTRLNSSHRTISYAVFCLK